LSLRASHGHNSPASFLVSDDGTTCTLSLGALVEEESRCVTIDLVVNFTTCLGGNRWKCLRELVLGVISEGAAGKIECLVHQGVGFDVKQVSVTLPEGEGSTSFAVDEDGDVGVIGVSPLMSSLPVPLYVEALDLLVVVLILVALRVFLVATCLLQVSEVVAVGAGSFVGVSLVAPVASTIRVALVGVVVVVMVVYAVTALVSGELIAVGARGLGGVSLVTPVATLTSSILVAVATSSIVGAHGFTMGLFLTLLTAYYHNLIAGSVPSGCGR